VVSLLLWVNEDGSVDHVQMSRGSGVDELDRAALGAAPELRFRAGMRAGLAVGTWVEFDVVFEPSPGLDRLAEPAILATPMIPEVEGWRPPVDWAEASVVPAPILLESREMLRSAMGGSQGEIEGRYGPLDGILNGDAPRGADPVEWRETVTRALDGARVRDPENPAPYLALARIRRSQGLRNDARLLFDEGLRRATAGARPVSPRLIAELAYESGRLVRENWLGWRDLGDLPVEALGAARCPGASLSPGAFLSMETVVAWNYACPGALGGALSESFQTREEGLRLRTEMLESFVTAVEAYPAHAGANTEILLDLADREAWEPLLEGARRFDRASRGHPHALLLEGLALHRLGRSEEARERFTVALEGLPEGEASTFQGDELFQAGTRVDIFGEGSPWRALDPILSTEINERLVEHWARAGYALLRFGSLGADASRVWLRYGRPHAMRTFGAGPGLRLELWDYGEGPDVTFYRPAASQNGALTPEAEEYLGELEGAVPHWYGTRARRLYALPAQVAQFRGSRDASVETVIRFDIPGEFRGSEARGPLSVGVFLLGSDGRPVERLRWSVEREQVAMELLVPAGPGVDQVVVEVYDAATGMAAAARRPVELHQAQVSDLLLARPDEEGVTAPRRRGEGSELLPGPVLGGADRVGAFLEVYDLPAGESYTVSGRLRPDGGGPAIPLEFRPWNEGRFAGEWVRRASDAVVTPELLEFDLRPVGVGSYTLELDVLLEDGTVVTRSISGVERSASVPGR
jgi:TonB family protein